MRGAIKARVSTGVQARGIPGSSRIAAVRAERGSVMVMSAVMIPVFLLLTALVMDVGNWYMHKRQLQGRADAGALAAGVEYAQNWKACVQTADPLLRASTALEIADAARTYAGDPEASDYAGAVLPATLRNTEIANQANARRHQLERPQLHGRHRLHGRRRLVRARQPSAVHTTGDDPSSPGHWTDVRVKERGCRPRRHHRPPLSRNGARARVEVRPAISGTRFLPLAVPNSVITKVQVRYYNHCTSPATLLQSVTSHHSPSASREASRLSAAARSGASPAAAIPPSAIPTSPSASRCPRTAAADRRTSPWGRGEHRQPQRDRPRREQLRTAARDAVRGLLLAALADPRVERRRARSTRSASATST